MHRLARTLPSRLLRPLRQWGAWVRVAASIAVAGCAHAAPLPPPTIAGTGQAPVAISIGKLPVQELSGIAWMGGTRYLAVGDNGVGLLWELDIVVDPATGRINSAVATGSSAVSGLASDGEGIALLAERGSVVVSDEAVSAIREFRLADSVQVAAVPVPSVYLAPNLRSNLGLESLGSLGGRVWTANEEALASDGPISSTTAGSLVRIQRFTAGGGAGSPPPFVPEGQWAYRVDPISALSPLTTLERSGAVEILPIASGSALVLERELGGALVPDFRARIYHIDTAGADDVSARASLASGGFVPLAKTLLWQGDFALQNFEGMTLGPELADGCRALLLVSDGNPGGSQGTTSLVALRVCGLPSDPADIDGSGAVDAGDLALVLGQWGGPGSADVNADGVVDGNDLAVVLAGWTI
jgi:hypothetical protein